MAMYYSDSDYEGSPLLMLVRTYKASCEYCGKQTSVTNRDRTGGICSWCSIEINASNVLTREIRKWYRRRMIHKRYKSVMYLQKIGLPIDIIMNIVYHI
jgi:hypothetical protein